MDKMWIVSHGFQPVRVFETEPEAMSFLKLKSGHAQSDITKTWSLYSTYVGLTEDERHDISGMK